MSQSKEAKMQALRRYWATEKGRLALRRAISKYIIKTNQQSREEIIMLLGGKCNRCGFSDVRALQIDHVNGGGTKDITEKGKHGSTLYYRSILKEIKAGSKDYQILCANCNWIKRSENREYPKRKYW